MGTIHFKAPLFGAPMGERLFDIEVNKEGPRFTARARAKDGSKREYKNQNFEDLLTEMLTDVAEEIAE